MKRKHTPAHLLSRDIQLNILVDNIAQRKFDTAHEHSSFIPNAKFFHEGWFIEIGGVKLQDNLASHIRQWIGKKALRQYLYDKDLVAWTVFSHITFDPLRTYLSSQSRAFQLWFVKHWTGCYGIGANMKQMKLWDNNLCPCCRQVPETSTLHIFLCPHPTMIHTRDISFRKIPKWLKDVDTDPTVLHIISKFWHNETPPLEVDSHQRYLTMYNILRDIDVHNMWKGLLPNCLLSLQNNYYQEIGSRRTASKWSAEFVGKMLRATHNLWMERNNILHLRTSQGIKGLEMIALETVVTTQFDLGYSNLNETDHFLLEKEKDGLLTEPIDTIRGWLCDILIARGDFASAQLESLRDRGDISHVRQTLSASEMREYLDWRHVCLSQRTSTYDNYS